jgi:hypothetical protein
MFFHSESVECLHLEMRGAEPVPQRAIQMALLKCGMLTPVISYGQCRKE